MRATHSLLRAVWEPMPVELYNAPYKLQAALDKWAGTPYRSGGRLCGVEGDCIGSIFGVVDIVDGRMRSWSPSLPADTALHNKRKAYEAVATLRRMYAPAQRLRPRLVPSPAPFRSMEYRYFLQPGDLLVVGTDAGGPGHLMIVGTKQNHLWHSVQSSGFTQTGWALGDGWERLFAAYRLMDRDRWHQ